MVLKPLLPRSLQYPVHAPTFSRFKAWFKEPNEPRKPLKESDAEMVNNLRQIIGQKLLDALTELDYSGKPACHGFVYAGNHGFSSYPRFAKRIHFRPRGRQFFLGGNGIWSIYKDVHENGAVQSNQRMISDSTDDWRL